VKILVPVGTRPEIVKLAPVVDALRRADHAVAVVATGQHHDEEMAGGVFADLGLVPDERWDLVGDEAARVGALLTGAFRAVGDHAPDAVMVLGDTYTVPVFALAARRHGVPVIHLEAGLRSFNPTSMEEVDRRVAAATAALHLAPTVLAARFLADEGVAEDRVRIVGNPVLDVLRARGVERRPPEVRDGVVVTAHRATNVDDPERLLRIVAIVRRLADEVGPVVFPVHPRTRARLDGLGVDDDLDHPGVHLLPPAPFRDMVDLVAGARVVVTDSGGLQEEAAWCGVPVVVLRRSTPRWEGVLDRTSVLVGLDVDRAVRAAGAFVTDAAQARVAAVPCPYGDGHTSERVVRLLADPAVVDRMTLVEPDLVDWCPA
jgi:UDP-N-acetylglucosamine 2-epimerase (non-hydrolysing)